MYDTDSTVLGYRGEIENSGPDDGGRLTQAVRRLGLTEARRRGLVVRLLLRPWWSRSSLPSGLCPLLAARTRTPGFDCVS